METPHGDGENGSLLFFYVNLKIIACGMNFGIYPKRIKDKFGLKF